MNRTSLAQNAHKQIDRERSQRWLVRTEKQNCRGEFGTVSSYVKKRKKKRVVFRNHRNLIRFIFLRVFKEADIIFDSSLMGLVL